MSKPLLTAVRVRRFPTFIDLNSYIGGQILMLTTGRWPMPGSRKPKEIWRRANIISMEVDDVSPGYLVVEVQQVSILKGGRYKADPTSSTTLHIRADDLHDTPNYSLLIETREDDLKMVYCFVEPGEGKKLPDEVAV